MRASVIQLGALTPDQEGPLRAILTQVDALQEQAIAEIIALADNGVDISDFKSRWNDTKSQLQQLTAELFSVNEASQIPDFRARAAGLLAVTQALMDNLDAAKTSGFSHASSMGMLWGLGISAAVATIAFVVWRGKNRRRVRRR